MTLHRTHRTSSNYSSTNTKNGRIPTDVASPVVWRYSRPTESPFLSHSSHTSMTQPKSHIYPLRIALIVIFVIYCFIPSRIVKQIASHPSFVSVSDAGRKVLDTLQTSVNPSNSSSVGRGECHKIDGQPAVSIVAACMNRQATLEKVLPTWLAIEGVHQIIIIDWNSDPPLKSIVRPRRDERIKLIRVQNEPSWVLSRAYNLAINASSCPYILRTDCDYSLAPDMLKHHIINDADRAFFTGNWLMARDNNEVHLNGALVVKRDVFLSVGGYDERIQTYGWDDEDLYTRLEARNMTRRNVSYDHVTHFTHDDSARAQTGVKFAQVQIDVNSLLLDQLPPWSKAMRDGPDASRYHILRDDDGLDGRYIEVQANHVPSSLQDRVSAHEYNNAWELALGRRLADDYHIPWDIIGAMSPEERERLLRALMRLQVELDLAAQNGTTTMSVRAGKRVPIPTHAHVIIVHCQHGLGNRLRALGSAMAFAKYSRRVIVVIWERDVHIAAGFHDLFEQGNVIVLSSFTPKWPFTKIHEYDKAWSQFKFYNYMDMEEKAVKGETIVNDVDKHIYYKGAYVLEAPDYTWWESANEQLRTLRPIQMVCDRLQKLGEDGIRQTIGVHIRNRTLDDDIKNVNLNSEYGQAAAEEMEQWRQQSSFSTFATEMERIINHEDIDARFYVASDTWQILDMMERRFPGRVMSTNRNCDDRFAECVKYAVIDMYALSYTKRLLGSNWSSYTEVAQRLGGVKAKLSGVDFGIRVSSTGGNRKQGAREDRKDESSVKIAGSQPQMDGNKSAANADGDSQQNISTDVTVRADSSTWVKDGAKAEKGNREMND